MRFGLQLAPLEGDALAESCAFMTRMAHCASECGYDVLVAPQHYSALPYRYPHAITLLARLAGETQIALATGVLPLPLLRPVEVTEAMATLEAVASAPCILGVGLGYRREEYEAFDVPLTRRGARMEDYLAAVKQIRADMRPVSGITMRNERSWGMAESWNGMPVWVGASARPGIERAARLGGSWFVGPNASGKEIADGLKVFNAARKHNDEVAGAVLPIRRDLLITSSDAVSREAAVARVRRRYKTYADWGLFAEGRTSLASDEPGHAAPADGPILGTIDECADALRSLRDSIPIEALVVLRLSWPGMEQREILTQIRLVADQLAPRLSDLNSGRSPTTIPVG
jgi:alkanesulfonate monooxygenase SsuD/methylene tetrahydromethanopterin reductase-like flavin-dependent oxidoreductase (luciferase family)